MYNLHIWLCSQVMKRRRKKSSYEWWNEDEKNKVNRIPLEITPLVLTFFEKKYYVCEYLTTKACAIRMNALKHTHTQSQKIWITKNCCMTFFPWWAQNSYFSFCCFSLFVTLPNGVITPIQLWYFYMCHTLYCWRTCAHSAHSHTNVRKKNKKYIFYRNFALVAIVEASYTF